MVGSHAPGSLPGRPRGSRWRWFPWTLRGGAFIVAASLGALLITLLFSPAVNTADLQRRDRLSVEGQFVDATYRYFLGRPADGAGLAEYQALYEREGPRAVALAIIASREFELKHAEPSPPTDPSGLAASFIQLYDSGGLTSGSPADWPGRVGFVVLIALTAAALVALQHLSWRQLGGSALHMYVPRWMIVGLFSALALIWFLNAQALFYAFVPGAIGYAEWLERVASLSMTRGLAHVWTPYPQATPMLLLSLEGVAGVVSSWLHSDVWTSYTLFRWMFQAVFLLVPSILLVSTTYQIGMLMSPAAATLGASLVAFSFAPLYYGITSSLVTDPLPVCVMLLAIWFLLCDRPGWAGTAIGLAGAMKLIPLVLIVPAVVLCGTWRTRWKLVVVPAIVMACVFVPFLVSDADIFWSPFRWQSGRPPWESLYAFVNWLVSAPFEYAQPAFEDLGTGHNFGWVFWGITPPLTALTSAVPQSPPHWENLVAGIGALASLLAVAAARSSGPRAVVRWAMYALAVTFFWSPGWSPQYELYLIPLAALAFESPLVAIGAVVALEVPTFLEYPLLLPWAYFYGGSAVWLAWAATLARYMVLAWLAVYVLRTEASRAALRGRFTTLTAAPGAARVAAAFARRRRPLAVHACALLLAGSVLLLPAPVNAQNVSCGPTRAQPAPPAVSLGDLDWRIPGGWFFTEASQAPPQGYSMIDDGSANMWSEFSRLGGWQVLGFPASQRFVWHGQLSQATQRAVLQWSQVTGQVEFANVLDLMHDEGRDADLAAQKQIPPPLDVDEAGLPYETIAANRLAWLDARPAIKSAYCNAPGGSDPLQLWGLPTSKAVNMSPSGGEVYVLRTQRAAFQEWVDGSDFAAPGTVTVVLAGDLAKEFELLPAEAVMPQRAQP
jgi:hypothetical protein